MLSRSSASGLFNFSAKHQRRRRGRVRRARRAVQRRPRGHLAGWLTAMLEYSQEPGVGAVGAKLLYPGRPAAARRHGARRRRRRGARVPSASRACRPATAGSAMHGAELLGGHRRVPDDAAAVFDEVGRIRRAASRSTSTTSTTACACDGPAIASSSRRGHSSSITSPPASARGSTTWASSARCASDGRR